MSQVIRLKRGQSAQASSLQLEQGEPAVCIDNGDFYVGTTAGKVKVNKVDSVNGKTGAVQITEVSGNAGSATKLQTARNIELTGDVTGTASFDGSKNITLTTSLGTFEIDGGTF